MKKIDIIFEKDNPNNIGFIQNLQSNISEGNKISVKWDWPSYDTNVNYVFAYNIDDANEDLSSLILRDAEKYLIPREAYVENNFTQTLRESKCQLVFYSVILTKDNISIYEQKSGNQTPIFHKRISLSTEITYDIKNILSGIKIANIRAKEKEKLKDIPSDSLIYYKYEIKSNSPVSYYPIDLEKLYAGALSVIVEKGYNIAIATNKKYMDAIILKS